MISDRGLESTEKKTDR